MKMFLDSIKKEVWHPYGKNTFGHQRLVRAPFDMVLMREEESAENFAWYIVPCSGSPDIDAAGDITANEPAASREMFPYSSGEKLVMEQNLFGDPSQDTIQACHFFGQV